MALAYRAEVIGSMLRPRYLKEARDLTTMQLFAGLLNVPSPRPRTRGCSLWAKCREIWRRESGYEIFELR